MVLNVEILHPGAKDQPHHHLYTFEGLVLQQIYVWKRTNLLTLSKSKYGVEQTFHPFQRNKKSLGHQTPCYGIFLPTSIFPSPYLVFGRLNWSPSKCPDYCRQPHRERLHAASQLIRTRTAGLKADRRTRWLWSYVSTGFTLVILRYVTCHYYFFFFGFHLLHVSAANNSPPSFFFFPPRPSRSPSTSRGNVCPLRSGLIFDTLQWGNVSVKFCLSCRVNIRTQHTQMLCCRWRNPAHDSALFWPPRTQHPRSDWEVNHLCFEIIKIVYQYLFRNKGLFNNVLSRIFKKKKKVVSLSSI